MNAHARQTIQPNIVHPKAALIMTNGIKFR